LDSSRHSKNISLHFEFTRKKRTRLAEINPLAAQKIQPELLAGETLCWAGIPNRRVIFHSDDWTSIPFSLAWITFFIFWEANALGLTGGSKGFDVFFAIWGIQFLLVGNYMVWGRFFHDAWLKRRTYYAVTSRRAFILQEGWERKSVSAFPHEISIIEREGTQTGTLWLGPKYPLRGPRGSKRRSMSRFSVDDVPVFADIDDVDAVHRLLIELHYTGDGAKDRGKPILSFPG
jgi:hypothetical protein